MDEMHLEVEASWSNPMFAAFARWSFASQRCLPATIVTPASRRSLPRRVPIRTVLPGAASCHVLRDSPLYPDQLRVPLQGATGLIRTSSLRVC